MRWLLFVGAASTVMLIGTPARADHGQVPPGVEIPPVVIVPDGLLPQATEDLYGWEPLGIVAGDDVRRYSLGTDRWAVWICDYPGTGVSVSLSSATGYLNSEVSQHYDWLSEGAYNMVFVSGGTVSASDPGGCLDAVAGRAQPGTVNGAVVIADVQTFYGFGGPGQICPTTICGATTTTYPSNSRIVFMGAESVTTVSPWPEALASLVTHEIGHGIAWPHSYTGNTVVSGTIWEYDNPIDLMSGNTEANLISTETASYSTLSFNRYAAGWIDPSDVVVYAGGTVEFDLMAVGSDGVEMAVLPLGDRGYLAALDARVSSSDDPIPTAWEGVSVHTIDQRPDASCVTNAFGGCYGLDRRTAQSPAVADALDHVMKVGDTRVVAGVTVTVVSRAGDGFRVRLSGGASSGSFLDTAGSPFGADIEWLADTGITKGCNPPVNDRFCPDASVTRGEMAAFLTRALGLTDTGGVSFADTGGSVFATDIARLANAGITRGCNPPTNDRFCPDDPITRGQMAAFLVRAFGLTDTGGISFVDTGGSVFATDIARLANAGITRGCNPPTNDRFCPDDSVTRGQMAAFLHRAEGYLP